MVEKVFILYRQQGFTQQRRQVAEFNQNPILHIGGVDTADLFRLQSLQGNGRTRDITQARHTALDNRDTEARWLLALVPEIKTATVDLVTDVVGTQRAAHHLAGGAEIGHKAVTQRLKLLLEERRGQRQTLIELQRSRIDSRG